MPLKRCKRDGKNGWQYGDSGKCMIGPGAKKKAIKQGLAIQYNGGPKFESRKDAKADCEDPVKFDEEIMKAAAREADRLVSRDEEKMDDLERNLMDRRDRLAACS
jgi:hypothetical protein